MCVTVLHSFFLLPELAQINIFSSSLEKGEKNSRANPSRERDSKIGIDWEKHFIILYYIGNSYNFSFYEKEQKNVRLETNKKITYF